MLHRNFLFSVAMLFLSIIFFSSKAFSGLWDYNMHIEVDTSDFNNARINAIKDNRKTALENVIDKFINISDFKIVNKLIDTDTAYFFEEKLRLLNESTNNNVYKVNITYYFNKNKILAFLNKNGIPYTTSLDNKILFIPIIDKNISNSNKWYKLFTINADDYLSKIFLLDNKDINKEKILLKDKVYLLELKNKYDVKDVIIADINTILLPKNNMHNEFSSTEIVIPEENYTLNVISVSNNTYHTFDNICNLHEAFKYTIGFSEIDVKNKIISSQDIKNTKIFKVVYNSFIDWVSIYNYLKQIPQVESVYLSELNEQYCIIKIKYYGTIDDIVNVALTRNIIIDTAELSITCKGFCY